MNTKQVIVVRKFPNLRTGKYCSQVAHASMAFLTKSGLMEHDVECGEMCCDHHEYYFKNSTMDMETHFKEITHWLENSFRKICVYVNSEQELDELHQKALDKGMISHMIEDNGATEFNGVKTKTAIAVGPAWDYKFEGLTDHLPLL
jgi:PTH2 family peptidyl-tRNA hydrolase